MKEKFKEFVRLNPSFSSYVNSGKTTWQKLYELYDMYGESSTIWDEFRKAEEVKQSGFNLGNIVNSIKGINLDALGENLNNIQKAVGFLADLTEPSKKKEEEKKKEESKFDSFYND